MAKTSGGIRTWNMTANQGVAIKRETAKDKIMAVFADFDKQGYSRQQPFAVGKVEKRMSDFAKANNITLGSDQLYMSSDSLGHGRRDSKVAKDIAVSRESLASFPRRRSGMRLYYNTEEEKFVYADKGAKYVVDPNYKIKISRKREKRAVFITATAINAKGLTLPNFTEIK